MMKFKNIEFLIKNGGDISIGRLGPVACAAAASDEHSCLAMLKCKPEESLLDILQRLDSAIENAWENEVYADEINEP